MQKILLTMAVVMMSALPAAAQTADQPMDQQLVPDLQQPGDCQAKPNTKDQQQKQQADTTELSETLDNCNGVLKPPPTGDKNATVPPDDNSQMPVIKPGELPQQQPK
ncbi:MULTISPECIES: hypothetical protein [unclassified Mesorhizobium]|uniref:hypothetical protein n=1 Tax=unclassified Mesorhizobium TaxID=325217 RepID=UPI000FCC4AE9|nr:MULTISPECIES: hypothetical protein [unclassified Mesorhizobium]TGP17943.1 hypothetical protein EN874_031480 [Mesorhizobium sp. M1D.F.Ca.ET.231.01.1.1]TGP24588.1 hypothetical protein EN877_31015 [Mesorhizobium sp. M1D.F.Ca.ET.234.01.1.1]TGS36887.1 hypothetical protein EN827_31475 [Mesorhizobium sp. M1D.F.Ca.ET.184.01.1.1]TGS57958.1 hypothetical protein EN826_031450 [Mesorhizobium sp. M1D.F.Ca.ET.183.01.1.1]